ncbi:MAG TPA: nuclease-related domain-containing protein [Ilumatobacteraceae bacterium]|jgi:hypothetical protein|nr:nuclease-related domain-containing protein [Ilumatobacteraceae bacterium]
MGLKLLTLRSDETCVRCARPVPARSRAWWDRYARSMVCVICEPVRSDDPLPPPPTIERGTVSSAQQVAERDRRAPGLVGRVMRLLADEPTTTNADAKRGEGERRLARLLDQELVDAVTLHDRKVPTARGSLDHLVIASSGIWLIDAERHAGEVECRSTGAFGSGEPRVFVDGRNQTRLVHAMGWQVAAVRAQLDTIGFGDVPVRPVVCFTSSRWARTTSPFDVHGVLVTWPSALVETIGAPGPFDVQLIDLVARHLSSTLENHGPSAAHGSR